MSAPRTVTFKSVLHGVQYRLGGSPEDLGTGTAQAIGEYIQSAYKYAWKHYEWPDVCRVEQFTTDANGMIGWDGVIETPFVVTTRDPRTDANPNRVQFTIHREGFYLPAAYKDAQVWVTYRPICPTFSAAEYDAATAYVVGDAVYWPETGHCYVSIQAGTGHDPDDTDYWEQQEFLESLSEAVKEGAHAAMVREEGQVQTSLIIQEAMKDLLLDEIERLEMQAGQYRLIRVDIP
jgi:hypothetical protein